MKGEKAEYKINLGKAFLFTPRIRVRKALGVIKKFVKKHTRAKEENIFVSPEVNEVLHLNSKNIPKKIDVTLLKEGDKVTVFSQKGKGLEEHVKKEKAKKEEKAKKDDKAKKEKAESKEKEAQKEEEKHKLEEKKEMEKSAQAAEIKRK